MGALILFLIGLTVSAAAAAIKIGFGQQQKKEAEADAAEVRSDLDTLLGAEQGKLTTEFETQTKRLTDYKETVLGSQRQALAVRGDFGGVDTAAAQILRSTEAKATEDQSALEGSYEAGLDVLEKQTELAKSQLDMDLGKYLSAITAGQINALTGFVSDALAGMGNMEFPTGSPTLLDTPGAVGDYRYPMPGAGWDSSMGVPRLN